MRITLTLDAPGIKRKVANNLFFVQQVLDERIAADSNYFCPKDTGGLQGSVLPVQGTGILEWNTPYAKAQYYGLPNKSTDSNPNASMKWFESAKSRKLKEWVRLANETYSR